MKIKQLSVFVENKTGRINEVTQILGSNGVNMTAFSLADSGEFGMWNGPSVRSRKRVSGSV